MNTYTLITIEETTINGISISGTVYQVPIDQNGDIPTNYLAKNRVIKNGEMLVFDTEQEYRDWLQQNT